MEIGIWSAKMKQPRTEKGTFESQYTEKRGQPIAIRLPESLDKQLREVVGWESASDNPKLKQWIEKAIAAQLSVTTSESKKKPQAGQEN
jgi:TfoX/Sxy family transcriptional regulator of competence genes